MSDNKLLAENTIRRFMKLANTETLTDNFLAEEEKYSREEMEARAAAARKAAKEKGETGSVAGKGLASMMKEEEDLEENTEELEENTEELEENLEDLEEQEEEMEMDVELGDEDPMDAEPEMDAPEMDAQPEMGEADMSLTEEEAQLLISLGERLAAAMGEAAGDEEPMDEPAMEEPEVEEPAPEEGEEEDDAAYRVDEESLVNEVLKRVTKRLVAEKLKNRK